ncbi:MAG: hypothetical protein ACFFC7_20750 [Candidatus Hermodarchaeota archaeon]
MGDELLKAEEIIPTIERIKDIIVLVTLKKYKGFFNSILVAEAKNDEISDEPLKVEELIPIIERIKNTVVDQNERLTKNKRKDELDAEKKILELENEIIKMKNELEEKEKIVNEKDEQLKQAELKRQQLEAEYSSLEAELKKTELFTETFDKQEDGFDRKLLSIYITLSKKFFTGQPHAKLLYLLHGGKSEMTRQELAKASGFSPAIVLHTLHELNRAGLVHYDEEEAKAKLTNRIY